MSNIFALSRMKVLALVTYCANGSELRQKFRIEHQNYNKKLKMDGNLVMAGSDTDYSISVRVYEAENLQTVEKIIELDPYFTNTIWTDFTLYPFNQVY